MLPELRLQQDLLQPGDEYAPPPNPGGTPFTAATYTAAKVNGFQVASATTDLSATQSVSSPPDR